MVRDLALNLLYATPESVKEQAPIEAVLAHYGHPLNADGYAICPFHDDHRPSLYLWDGDDGQIRWYCQPCGFGGDQIDFVRRYKELPFARALVELARIAPLLPEAPRRRAVVRDRAVDRAAMVAAVIDARERALEPNYDGYMSLYAVGFVSRSDARPDDHLRWDSLLRELGWGVDDRGNVVMPHWGEDRVLTGAKVRAPVTGDRWSLDGSTYPDLYMSWRLGAEPLCAAVLLAEGETDAAWAEFHARRLSWSTSCPYPDGVNVRALPAGAGGPITDAHVAHLGIWPRVYLALDADNAGRAATDRWAEALGGVADVMVCRLPDGRDVRSAGLPLERILADAEPASSW